MANRRTQAGPSQPVYLTNDSLQIFSEEATPVYSVITQNVIADAGNSSTANLNAGATFTGVSVSTLGVAAIQVTLKTDQNCTVYVDQSPDGSNWDIVDTYNYIASLGNFGVTVQAVNSYTRVRVKNIGTANTTYLRLQTALCPIVEAVPRSLDADGNLRVAIKSMSDSYGFEAENTPFGEMRVVQLSRLVGASFEGDTIDANYWVTAAAGTAATIAQANAELELTSGTSNGAAVTAYTSRRARYIGGNGMRYRAVVRISDGGVANNKRRWGVGYGASMPTITDGAWFQIDGTTFSIVTCRATTETPIASGSFNGVLGTTYTPGTNVTTYEIYWSNSKVYFVIGGRVLHTVSAATATWAATMSPYVFMDSLNADVLADAVVLHVRAASIYRLGQLATEATSKYLAANATTILKRGLGRLHSVLNCDNVGSVSIYDGLSAAGTLLATVDASKVLGNWNFNIPFSLGLTVVVGTNAKIVVIYE